MRRLKLAEIACALALLGGGSPLAAERVAFVNQGISPGRAAAGPVILASLVFTVSVCLDDVEYSSTCRQRSLLEATKRLEQLYFDDYTNRRVAGTLTVSFAIPVDATEQLRFLREVEDRAITATATKLQAEIDQFAAAGPPVAAIMAGQLPVWRDAAVAEARRGSNWLHYWGERSHQYRSGAALDQLARIKP